MVMPRYGATLQTLIDWYHGKYHRNLGLRVVARLGLQVRGKSTDRMLTRRQVALGLHFIHPLGFAVRRLVAAMSLKH